MKLSEEGLGAFYLEALIDQSNAHSINVAKKFFPDEPDLTRDRESGIISLQFKKVIYI